MIKLVYCLRKRDDVDHASFYRYWLEEHGPLVKSVAGAIGASRYVQSHTILPELNETMVVSRGLQTPYDGVTEVWWETMSALEHGMSSPEGVAAQTQLIEDEARFIDFSQSRVFMTEEHHIFNKTSLLAAEKHDRLHQPQWETTSSRAARHPKTA